MRHVGGVERIAAGERQSAPLDAAVVEIVNDAIAHRLIERLAPSSRQVLWL